MAVSERAEAQKRLAENPFDVSAMCMLTRAQEQVEYFQPNALMSSDGLRCLARYIWVEKLVS